MRQHFRLAGRENYRHRVLQAGAQRLEDQHAAAGRDIEVQHYQVRFELLVQGQRREGVLGGLYLEAHVGEEFHVKIQYGGVVLNRQNLYGFSFCSPGYPSASLPRFL